ncbi:DUF2913 family protein [Psychromonas sp. MME2]|uniref:DUF2913 family protein n=1 Tax=unclassified Psychromonas TaxID=2614957 RepID=UPI00339CC663
MAFFSQEIYTLVNSALTDLAASQATGKTPKNALSEAHYFAAWITTAIKNKRFDSILLETLKDWQKQVRSLNKNARLKEQFIHLQHCYKQILDEQNQVKNIDKSQLIQLFSALESKDWLVTTDLVVGDRLNRHSGGKNSLIVCVQQLNDCFDEQQILTKPLSLYLRGEQQCAIDLAFTENIFLYKKRAAKSNVKFHNEYLICAKNDGDSLPELPSNILQQP